jgi:hypothetical protein
MTEKLTIKDLRCSTCDNFLDSQYSDNMNEMITCKELGNTYRHDCCAAHSSFTNPTKHLSNLIKHFEAMNDHEDLYLCNVIALLKGETKI